MFMENIAFNKTYVEYRNKQKDRESVKRHCDAKVISEAASSTNYKKVTGLQVFKKKTTAGACC